MTLNLARLATLAWMLCCGTAEPLHLDTASLKNIANVTYASEKMDPSGHALLSPRMDFEHWKPMTGRGDPLRNDPTYDYEPPVLERVHYWAEERRRPDKSEVLMLGVSSRKPSVSPRPHPPSPPRRHRPHPIKYEDYSYKLSEHYPMTILVPPPLPPPNHKPILYILSEETPLSSTSHIKITDPPKLTIDTSTSDQITSLYTLQESNLIYQSSSTSHSWITEPPQTSTAPSRLVSSDYAGWGPTTHFNENDYINDTYNLIPQEHLEYTKHPYSFYKPMLSEAPPPPRQTINPLQLPTFVPTVLPPTELPSTDHSTQTINPTEPTPEVFTTTTQFAEEETTTNKNFFQSTPSSIARPNTESNIFDMLNPMMSMPLVNGPERLEDNLYAHASENLHVYQDHQIEDTAKLETMQTMQPPPPLAMFTESPSMSFKQPLIQSNIKELRPAVRPTLDPYLHMRFTTMLPTIATPVESFNTKTTTEPPTVPMYLIIQGHSKVKTYGSIPKPYDAINNEIPKANETDEVKHLHPIKARYANKPIKNEMNKKGKAQNLKALVDTGRGSIEIQDADVGIKYDVSDGSEVPLEIYRKGIVDTDENDYSKKNKREKRQLNLEDILPFDEDQLEEYVYNYLKSRRNETGILGHLAKAVTGKASAALDDLDDDSGEDR